MTKDVEKLNSIEKIENCILNETGSQMVVNMLLACSEILYHDTNKWLGSFLRQNESRGIRKHWDTSYSDIVSKVTFNDGKEIRPEDFRKLTVKLKTAERGSRAYKLRRIANWFALLADSFGCIESYYEEAYEKDKDSVD